MCFDIAWCLRDSGFHHLFLFHRKKKKKKKKFGHKRFVESN